MDSEGKKNSQGSQPTTTVLPRVLEQYSACSVRAVQYTKCVLPAKVGAVLQY